MTRLLFSAAVLACFSLIAGCDDEPSAAAGPAASNFGTISLAPGFMPDPSTGAGSSGGAVDATSLNSECSGWVSDTPDHLFVAEGVFPSVRILARATNEDKDITLVVQKPDGSYACDDDTEGTNPVVAITSAAAGTYKVWVGSYTQGEDAGYHLGISEMSSTLPSAL